MSIHRRDTSKGIVYDVRLRDYGRKNISRTFRNHREAKQFEHFVLTKKAQEEFPEIFSQKKQRITFEQLAKQWLELHSKPNKAPKSYTKDRGVLSNYLVPRFGDRPIHRVGTADIQQYLAERLEGICRKTQRPVAPATVNRELEIIRKMFNDAIAWGYLQENPCRGIRKLREVMKKYQCLTEEEVAGLLEHASDNDKALLATAVYTGMRFGELVNLEPRHVDLKLMQITVEIGNVETGTTKSRKIRYVPIATALYPYLKQQLVKTNKYVFPAKRKELMQRTEVDKAFRSALRRIGVDRHIRFHDLRHTFASHFVMRGGDLMSLKEILGHSSLQMVQRYAHLAPDHLRRGIDRLNYSRSELGTISRIDSKMVSIS